MKKFGKTLLSAALLATASTALQAAEETAATPKVEEMSAELKGNIATASFGFGFQLGQNLQKQADTINQAEFLKGLKAAIAKDNAAFDQKKFAAAQAAVQKYFQSQAQKKAAVAAESGAAFLEANKAKEGVTVTASGLQYKVLTASTKADGKTPTAADTVKVHYHGTLPDGTVFDSSVDRGEPISFPLGQVVKGWTEGLQLMKEGDKFELVVPDSLGYNGRGPGGPGAVMIFEVELIEVTTAPAAKVIAAPAAVVPAK